MIKAVIYDLDDTIVDSIGIHTEANNAVFSEYVQKDLPEDLKAKFVGMRVIDIISEIIEHFGLNLDPREIYKKRNEIFFTLVNEKLELLSGVKESLNLAKKEKLLIALATSGSRRYIDIVLDKFHLRKYFAVIITGDDVMKGKPDPETYLKTVEKLRLNPAECLVLEDATTGIKSAKDAGCKCIAILNPHTPKQDLSKADMVINSLGDLNKEALA